MLAEAAHASTDRTQVIAALQQASAATGSDFHYLLGTAMRESSLKPQAQSSTSSAAGLFQFVGQTWLGLVKQHGAKYGLGSYAQAIAHGNDGRYRVDNAADRQAILALRNDPKVSALMAGEFANQTRSTLASTLGRDVCNGELYAAHFLGPGAACRLIQMNESAPNACAANAFPQAADANKSVFYHSDGTAKTVREVYNWALNQPGGDHVPAPAKVAQSAPSRVEYRTADAPDASALLSSMMNWSPRLASFSPLAEERDSAFPVTPFLLTPGVMDLLSSVSSPAASRT